MSADADAFTWSLRPHICRVCMGRVMLRITFDGKRLYRCSNCGTEVEGATDAALCCCGIRLGKNKRDAGVRCVPNTDRKPECMSEIVAVQAVLDRDGGRINQN